MSWCWLCRGMTGTRRCQFGEFSRVLCTDCLAQFKVENNRVVLHDRYLGKKCKECGQVLE